MGSVLEGNCCETSSKNTYEGVYREEFCNKIDAF